MSLTGNVCTGDHFYLHMSRSPVPVLFWIVEKSWLLFFEISWLCSSLPFFFFFFTQFYLDLPFPLPNIFLTSSIWALFLRVSPHKQVQLVSFKIHKLQSVQPLQTLERRIFTDLQIGFYENTSSNFSYYYQIGLKQFFHEYLLVIGVLSRFPSDPPLLTFVSSCKGCSIIWSWNWPLIFWDLWECLAT